MKLKFRKQMAVVFGAIAMISYISIRFFPAEETVSVVSTTEEVNYLQVYMIDEEKTLVPLSVPISEELNVGDKISLLFSYMSGKQEIKGFLPLFEKECILQASSVKDGTVSLYFDDTFLNYKRENELRVLEAITWGVSQFHDIKQVELYVNNQRLSKMPMANTPIPDVLSRDIGINHFETSTSSLHDSDSLTVFYTKQIQGNMYMVPKSKRVNRSDQDDIKTKIDQILSDICVSSSLKQPLSEESIQVKDYKIQDGTIMIDLNSQILSSNQSVKQDVYNSLVLSLSLISGIEKIDVRIDGVSLGLSADGEEPVSVYSLYYNEIQF